jgi:hypothetical protein
MWWIDERTFYCGQLKGCVPQRAKLKSSSPLNKTLNGTIRPVHLLAMNSGANA